MRQLTSLTRLRKLFNSLGFFVPALCTFALHLVPEGDSYGAIILLILTMSFLQLAQTGGFFLSHSDLVGPYSGLAFGITNTIAQFPGFITALLGKLKAFQGAKIQNYLIIFLVFSVAYMTPNGTRTEWLNVYDIAGAICVLGGLVYLIFGSSELQAWAKNDNEGQKEDQKEAKV